MRSELPNLTTFAWRSVHDIRFSDLDPMGHVNNAAYMSIMEESRTRLLVETAGKAGASTGFTMAHLDIDFVREIGWPAQVTAAVGVEKVGNSSIHILQAVFLGESCAAHSRTVIVSFDLERRQPIAIKREMRELLAAYAIQS